MYETSVKKNACVVTGGMLRKLLEVIKHAEYSTFQLFFTFEDMWSLSIQLLDLCYYQVRLGRSDQSDGKTARKPP